MKFLVLQSLGMYYKGVPTIVYASLLLVFCLSLVICFAIKGFKNGWRTLSKIALVEILFLIYGSTVLFRKYVETRGHNFQPFWSYEAIGNGEEFYIEENFFNFLFFLPVGLLLGCAFRSMTWWKVMIIGICVSASIEMMQYVYNRGFAEVDDVIHNTLGCLMGYGTYKLLRYGHERFNSVRDNGNIRV